jgi:hypothetical protein
MGALQALVPCPAGDLVMCVTALFVQVYVVHILVPFVAQVPTMASAWWSASKPVVLVALTW